MNARPEPTQRSALDARDDLLYIADRWPALKAMLMTGKGGAQTGMPGMVMTESPLVLDIAVLDLMREIEDNVARHYGRVLIDEVPTVHGCSGACHGSLDHECPDDCAGLPTVPRRCPQRVDAVTTSAMPALLVQVARRYGHFEGLAFSDDAHDYRERVAKTLERPEAARYVGPCQVAECVGELYVGAGRATGKCRTCGTPFALDEQRAWVGQQLDARLMTAREIWRALKVLGTPVPLGTIESWVDRDRLAAVETDPALYRLADAQDLAEARVARMAELRDARGEAA